MGSEIIGVSFDVNSIGKAGEVKNFGQHPIILYTLLKSHSKMNSPDLDQPPAELSTPSPKRLTTPLRVWIGLAITVALDAPVQLVWKALMMKYRDPAHAPVGDAWHHIRWFFHQTRTYLLFTCFVLQFCDWIWVLGNTDLSFAQPFTALSYVIVSTGAVVFFHEHLSPFRIVGIGLILIGVVLVGSSEHRTTLTKETD